MIEVDPETVSQPQGDDDNWMDIEGDSPQEQVDTYPSCPSPPDDLATYNALIKRAAENHGVQLEEERNPAKQTYACKQRRLVSPNAPWHTGLGERSIQGACICQGVDAQGGEVQGIQTRRYLY